MDYQNGKIYKILNHVDDEVYVGSTCQSLSKRISYHRHGINNERYKNRSLYKLMKEYGVDNFYIELVEDFPCERLEQLRSREGYYIRQIGTLNKLIAGRKRNDEDVVKEKQEYDKKYRVENAEHKRERDRLYRENNLERINALKKEKTKCLCGGSYTRCHKTEHERSQKHQNYLKSISEN